jgi:hypothetical protein
MDTGSGTGTVRANVSRILTNLFAGGEAGVHPAKLKAGDQLSTS